MAYRDIVLGDHPCAYYRLGESSGTTAADEVGGPAATYADSGVTYSVTGLIASDSDTAVALNSGSSVGVTCPFEGLPTGSWEIWFASDDAGSIGNNAVTQRLISQYRSGTTDTRLCLGINNNKIAIGYYDGSLTVIEGSTTLSSATAYHAVMTWDGTTIKVYLNGNTTPEVNSAIPVTSNVGSRHMDIGSHGGSRTFDGVIDEVAFYPNVLTAAQVERHYNAGANPQQIGNNATNSDTDPVDSVIVFDWTTKQVVEVATPDGAGDWTAQVPEGVYGVTYISADFQPVTHGPYNVAP